MKPAPFEYLAASSLDAALAALAQHGSDAKLLAGGQSLIPMMNFRLAQPALLVDLNGLGDLDFVRASDTGLRLGALTRQARLAADPVVAEHAPLLARALPFVAHPQIRNRGTLGGSLAHADPAAELPVVALALGARLRLSRESGGERWLAAEDFFVGLLTTALEPEEILVEVEIPPLPPRTGCAFLEIARRHGDYAQAGLGAVVSLDESGRCTAARLVYLSAGDTPVPAPRAAALLVGETPRSQLYAAAAETAAREEIDPAGDIHATAEFKRHLARVLTVRALGEAFAQAQDGLRRQT